MIPPTLHKRAGSFLRAAATMACYCALTARPAAAQSINYADLDLLPTIYINRPYGGLLQALDGNIYGTSAGGIGGGTVFVLDPVTYYPTVLYSFAGPPADGAGPQASLIQATDGNFYGTTVYGGAYPGPYGYGQGTVFKITPGGTETVLHSFGNGSDGTLPYSSLVQASDGNLYGTTSSGGLYGHGTVFKITLNGTESVLYSFSGYPTDGSLPYAGLVQATDGNLYGTTVKGGIYPSVSGDGNGTVFKITTAGKETLLHSFGNGSDGSLPYAGLIQATDGNFYGTTYYGGASGLGAIFKITTGGTESLLHSFAASGDADVPYAGLIQATDGNFYGTTTWYDDGTDWGALYKITLQGAETVLHNFDAYGQFFTPYAGLIQAKNGLFYGAALSQTATFGGSIFAFSPTSVAPVLTALQPASAAAGGSAFNLTVYGLIFVSGATIQWNGSPLTTTFGSATQLSASVPASAIATPGMASVTVTQNGTTSNAFPFTIANPQPVLTGISPASKDAGGPAFTLVVKGASFSNSSTVDWNGSPLTTTFVSASQMKAAVPASLISSPGTAKVTVVTPSPGGGTSASKTFTILQTTLNLTTASLVKNADGSYTAMVSLKNVGFLPANSIAITKATLGAAATTTSLPASAGNIAAGATATTSLQFPSSAGASGTIVSLKLSGTFTGGKFSGSLKVTLP